MIDKISENIILLKSVFRCREDVYAIRWEKNGKSGYMPAYDVNWETYRKHKAQGGTFRDFEGKKPRPLTDSVIREHLSGYKTIGIYPLLTDNTSFFIAADFDQKNWIEESLSFISVCIKYSVPAYLERSRSGNGGHVWVFFKNAYPALKSRKIAFELIRKALKITDFEKEISFDRLFPSQEYQSGQGFGNLIVLPLNGVSIRQGNSCFLNRDTLEPFTDQWELLRQIQFVETGKLDGLFAALVENSPKPTYFETPSLNGALQIVVKNQIFIHRSQLNPTLIHFIRESLNFPNADYIIKKKIGKSTYETEKYFKLIEEGENEIMLPRGFVAPLVAFCKEKNIPFQVVNERKKMPAIAFNSKINLYDHQDDALDITDKKDFGVIVAPPGSGKTIMGLELIARKEQPALIIVHRKQLFDQWMERIQAFLSVAKKDIGQITTGKDHIGKQVTVAMIQSLSRMKDFSRFTDAFGTIVVDECHHIPAKTFRETIVKFNAYYLYGLTATPKRKNNDEKLIYVYVGEILSKIPINFNAKELKKGQEHILVIVKETNLYVPFDYRIDKYETISRILIYDCARNQMIADDIISQVNQRRRILVLTERKEHVNVLNLYLKDKFETITITGDDSDAARKSKLEQIRLGHFQVLIATGQLFGEGIDVDTLECLFLVYPFAFEGKLIQYVGRIQRSEKPPVIYDYRDSRIDYFEKLFKKRNRYYKKLQKTAEPQSIFQKAN